MFLESIGGVALVAGLIYAIFLFLDKKDRAESINSKLIEKSDKCQELVRKHRDACLAINPDYNPDISYHKLKKELTRIVNDPREKERALANIERENKYEKETKSEDRKKRKIGYKYEIDIFEIFNRDQELTHKELTLRIMNRFNLDDDKAQNLLTLWQKNGLIGKCFWDSNSYEIDTILNCELYNIDEDDLTWDKWLLQNNITLKPESKKKQKFLDDYENEDELEEFSDL